MTKRINYAELDPNMVALAQALNSLPGVTTIGSCGGHDNPMPGQWQKGSWYMKMDIASFEAIEFLAWLINNDYARAEHPVSFFPIAPPPHLNGFGKLSFVVEGYHGEDPDELAGFIVKVKHDIYNDFKAKEGKRKLGHARARKG